MTPLWADVYAAKIVLELLRKYPWLEKLLDPES
jgi:hypothetical protein